MPTTTETNNRAAPQAKSLSGLVHNLKIAFHAKRAITEDGHFCSSQEFLLRSECSHCDCQALLR